MSNLNPLMGPRDRRMVLILGTLLLILLAFTTQMILAVHRDVASLKDVLATKAELANLAVCLGPADPAMVALRGTCTRCHSEEAFAQAHGYEADIHDLVTSMVQFSDARIAEGEIPKIEAALTFMKCAHCHEIDRVKELAILDPQDRWGVIVAMMNEEGATISPEDAQRIRDFYGDFWGWHTP